jgi:chitodextrinase
VRGIDAAANLGDGSAAVQVTIPDRTAPSAPAALTAAAAVNPGRVDLAWQASTDGIGVTGYEVSRNGVVVATLPGTATAYTDSAVTSVTAYSYSVVALDAAGNRSAAAGASATTPDLAPPSAVGGLSGSALDGPPRVTLTWRAATDDVGIAAYDVYRDGTLVTSTGSTTVTDTAVTAGPSYAYTVKARDAAGNLSAAAAVTVTIVVVDRTAPTVPTAVRVTAYSRPVRVSVSWAASSDSVGVKGYRVYRNGVLIGTCASTGCSDANVAPRTTYRYAVSAYDAAGNASAPSASVTVTTPAK